MPPTTEDLARRWLGQDNDPATRAEIEQLLRANDTSELEKRLRTRIAFGTAGLRSAMKAGFAHMNSLTVLQASQGLADYILAQNSDQGRDHLSIVVGHDARHNSAKFAHLSAAAFLSKGFRVLWFGRNLVHTPMVPFAVSHHRASAGVMVTASHNPKNDNGYKVYWGNGCQIIPPHDKGIAEAIDRVDKIATWDDTPVANSADAQDVFEGTQKSYFEAIEKLVSPLPEPSQSLSFTYTAMHGVGLPFMQRVASILQCTDTLHIVDSQATPDPEFPTVHFPNPEEKGALDLAKSAANASHCSLILANDPDADRFAAVERLPDGSWHQFTGNQMGVLLAHYILSTQPQNTDNKLLLLASTVSSRMLAHMSTPAHPFTFRETLTGFKWLGNAAQLARAAEGLHPVYAYEEAIGYMFPSVVWDKDGIAAATVFLKACQTWRAQGTGPHQVLQGLYERFGSFAEANGYLISPSSAVTERVFEDVRAAKPESVGGRRITRWRDLTLGVDTGVEGGEPVLPVDAGAQMVTCELEGEVVFTVRGSGTEPKLKIYIEGRGLTEGEAKTKADGGWDALVKELFDLAKYGLKLAGT